MTQSSAISSQIALARQSFAIEALKISAQQQESLVALIAQSVETVAASQTLGTNVDISA